MITMETKLVSPQIRAITLGLIRDQSRLFVFQDYDSLKQDYYYRALGGGIEFGETSETALRREFREEINAEIKNLQYLGCLENLFTLEGKPGHEIIQVYQCDFVDPKFYTLEPFKFKDGSSTVTACWVEINQFISKQLRLVPETFLNYLK